MAEFSVFDYLYRDASNYKAWGSLLLEGSVTKEDIEVLRARLDGGEFFIAEQVGVPTLYAELWKLSNGPSDDDHVWHTFHELRPANPEDISEQHWGRVVDLVARFKSISKWDERLSPHWDI
jgi:hypothetical protein